jgi:glycosyltransferase involved in cell wall biosynthesis
MDTLIICSKSRWHPTVRREHAFATQAAQSAVRTSFVEAPTDIRTASGHPRRWWAGLTGMPTTTGQHEIEVWGRSTLIPGHHSRSAESTNTSLLRRTLGRVGGPDAVLLGMVPWDWPAIAQTPAARRVFDCTDDWSRLIPRRRDEIRRLFKRVADEADAIAVTSAALSELFTGREVVVVANGVARELLDTPRVEKPNASVMTYVGTLSERFDAPLMEKVLTALPTWRLTMYGECRYAGEGGKPGAELRRLLAAFPDRAHWAGPVSRAELADKLDAADVLVLPNRRAISAGQSSMKLYDYCTRGRPIVASTSDGLPAGAIPPGVTVAPAPDEFAAAVVAGAFELPIVSQERLEWARLQTWEHRWPLWSGTAFGHLRASQLQAS